MKKLLVAVDGSGAAQRALQHAIALARTSPEASIHLVHAHEEPDIYGEIAVYVPRAKMAELQRMHSERVLDAAEEAAGLKDCGVRYTKEVLTGPIGQTIARHAEHLHLGHDIGRQVAGGVADFIEKLLDQRFAIDAGPGVGRNREV